MSFLDNLENSLKSLENQGEAESNLAERHKAARENNLAIAPWAERLRSAPFTKELMEQAAVFGHRLRAKVYMAWLGDTLRFEAKGHSCELVPTPSGIVARYQKLSDGASVEEPVNLESASPAQLLQHWLD